MCDLVFSPRWSKQWPSGVVPYVPHMARFWRAPQVLGSGPPSRTPDCTNTIRTIQMMYMNVVHPHMLHTRLWMQTRTHTVTQIILCIFFVWSFLILVVIICINLFVYRFNRCLGPRRLFQPHRSWTIESRRIARLHTQPNSQENPCQHHVPAQKFRIVNDLISCVKSIPHVSPWTS